MSDSPQSKRGKSTSSTDQQAINDDVIPLLIAANPAMTLNYKAMAQLDPGKHTASSFEHKFRKWKARATELKLGSNNIVGGDAAKAADTPGGEKAPAKRARAGKKGAAKADHEPAVMTEKDQLDVGLEEPTSGGEDGVVERPTTGRKGPMKAPVFSDEPSLLQDGAADNSGEIVAKKANVTRKRTTKSAEVDGESVAKKTRVVKKGTAKVVKKDNSIEEGEKLENKADKPKAKGKKAKAATIEKPKPKPKAKEPQTQDLEIDEGSEIQFE